jgi:hypothetical protein
MMITMTTSMVGNMSIPHVQLMVPLLVMIIVTLPEARGPPRYRGSQTTGQSRPSNP